LFIALYLSSFVSFVIFVVFVFCLRKTRRHELKITSLSNPHIKAVVKLQRGQHRRQVGLTIVEEARSIERAMAAGLKVEEFYLCPPLAPVPAAGVLAHQAAAGGAAVFEVPPEVLAKMAYRQKPEGVLAVVRVPRRTLEELPLGGKNPLLVVVEHLEKPGNLGAILRSLDAAGGQGLILCDRRTDIYNPNVIRASTGVVFLLPVVEAPLEAALAWLRARGIRLLAATPEAPRPYTAVNMTGPTALALGSEHLGLSEALKAAADELMAIPMHGLADSLNVAAAATVLLFEAARQRRRES
jgi:TrmH family RNA methyltransferase